MEVVMGIVFTKITPTQNMTILVESFWGKLQNFRCVVTRYDINFKTYSKSYKTRNALKMLRRI